MKIFFITLISLFQTLSTLTTEDFSLVKETAFPSPASKVMADNLGNIYFISNNQFYKTDLSTRKTYQYSSKTQGAITNADISDPLRIILFYKDFNQVIFLDKFLAEIGSPVSIDELGHQDVDFVCSSAKGGFWLYDNHHGQLYYYNSNLEKEHQSISLHNAIEESPVPSGMFEYSGKVYLNIPSHGIMMFNQFANYIETIPLVNIKDFQIINNSISYFQHQHLFVFDTEHYNSYSMMLPDTNDVISSKLIHNSLYIFKEKSYSIYNITKK